MSVVSKKPADPKSSGPDSLPNRSENAFGRELVYTEDSNTLFYYNDYRVVLLLDFSQSTTCVYPTQQKNYMDKMRDSIEIVTKNLLFNIENKLKMQNKGKNLNINGESTIN